MNSMRNKFSKQQIADFKAAAYIADMCCDLRKNTVKISKYQATKTEHFSVKIKTPLPFFSPTA